MNTITADNEAIFRFPDDPSDYTIDDHVIVAAAAASDAVEAYWNAMGERPSLVEFEAKTATHLSNWKTDEAGWDTPF